jgi:cytidine deaminase
MPTLTDLTPADQDLLRAAAAVSVNAFAPVSRFQVGAALRAADGRVFRGVNMEVAALPLGVCAEPAALTAALTDGVREFDTIAVAGGDPAAAVAGRPVTPCGGCRQRIYDVTGGAATDLRVLCANLDLSEILVVRITELLPYAFDAADLPAASWSAAGS